MPYKGGAAAITDLIAGRVQVMFESLNSIAPFAKSGQVRPLARHRRASLAGFPRLPTVAEAGVPGYAAPTWSGVVAPAGTPRPIVDKLNEAANKALQSEGFKSKIAQIGDDVAGGTPEESAAPDRVGIHEMGRRDPARRDQIGIVGAQLATDRKH